MSRATAKAGRAPARLRIGTSGYQYDHWKEIFYPKDLPKRRWFDYYAQHFDTVEINNTFYRLPGAKAFDSWREQAPKDFLYALKFSRYGTHVKRLKDPAEPIERFLSVATRLGAGLGPILVQLPPHWHVNLERLQQFLQSAPAKYRWAFEFRDASWLSDEVFRALEAHRAALCIHDKIAHHPDPVTADFVYLRYHGGQRHEGNYSPQFLRAQARRIERLLGSGLDVYAYFNNDPHGHALRNAERLKKNVRGEG